MHEDNIIQKQIVYVDTHAGVNRPLAVQDAAVNWCNEVLLPAISQMLEKYCHIKEVIRIDKINVDINTARGEFNESAAESIAAELERVIKEKISTAGQSAAVSIVKKERLVVEAFIFFLQSGYLPWWSGIKTIDDVKTGADDVTDEDRTLFKSLLNDGAIVKRFATALPLPLYTRLVSVLLKINDRSVKAFFKQIETLAQIIQDNNRQHQFLDVIKIKYIAGAMQNKDDEFMLVNAVNDLRTRHQIPAAVIKKHIGMNRIFSKKTVNRIAKILEPDEESQPTEEQPQMRNDPLGNDVAPDSLGKLMPPDEEHDVADMPLQTDNKLLLNNSPSPQNEAASDHNDPLGNKVALEGTGKMMPPDEEQGAANAPLQTGSKLAVNDGPSLQTEGAKENKKIGREWNYQQKTEGIEVANAGLVLLAPFLPLFFENLGIVEGSDFNSTDGALAVLQWLATGNEQYAEFDLVLPKILCGIEPEEPVQLVPRLPLAFKTEGEVLLQSVIKHWSIIKNTSVEGLRESFLQRDGKLSLQNDEWLLQVEQKPFDMVLEHLPWNLSMTRLSWMTRLLRTEWFN